MTKQEISNLTDKELVRSLATVETESEYQELKDEIIVRWLRLQSPYPDSKN